LKKTVLHNKKHFQKNSKTLWKSYCKKIVENIMVKNCGEKIWNETKFRKIIEKNWRKKLEKT
jgi:hypothetical protein